MIFQQLTYKTALITFLLFIMTNSVYAQTEKLTLESTRLTAEKVIKTLETQTRYRVAFSNASFDVKRIINFSEKRLSVLEILDALVKDSNVKYVLQDKYIALVPINKVEQVVETRTDDVYVGNKPDSISARPVIRIKMKQQQVKYISADEKEYPESYSNYTAVDKYPNLQTALPRWAIKTNLLYYPALTPNLGIEFAISPKSTIELMGGYSFYGREKKTLNDTKQFVHSLFRAEYRYWLCERFSGHYIGGHAFLGIYNVSGIDVPLLFKKDYRYEGTAYGAGFTYGYNLPLSKRWGLGFNIGLGAAYMKYDRYTCALCDKNPENKSKVYLGPTRAGVNLVFLLK